MKIASLLIVPVLALAAAGCTVNHYHYYSSVPPSSISSPVDIPGKNTMADRLVDVHAAMQVVANNIANVNTNGYKTRKVSFQENQSNPQIMIDWSNGPVVESAGDFDLAIIGQGFFQVEIDSDKGGGIGYTRAGNFMMDAEGGLVLGNSYGPRLADGMNVPDEAVGITISSIGVVTALIHDGSSQEIGSIQLHRFINPQGLENIGGGIYCATEASGPAIVGEPGEGAMGTVLHRHLESSNVNLIAEIFEIEKLNRLGWVLSQQLGPAVIQNHSLFASKHYAMISNQVDLVDQLDEAMQVVDERRVAREAIWPRPVLDAAP